MSERWHRIRDLFERALDQKPADVEAWIDREAADDPAVAAELRSLLQHHSRAGSFLSEPIADRVPDAFAEGHALEPGQTIGSYTIVREAGRGGMGRVYLATDARLGRQVALKVLPPWRTDDPSERERLRREARAAAALTHPGICTIYALEELDGQLFIAAEFVEGHTLREEIERGTRPAPQELLRTARELAAALASAHAKGITHRDLKPENVMRTGDGRLKILDFGLARFEEAAVASPALRVTRPGALVGTPGYMAPEQLNGQSVDARTDVFALGVLLYEYACGTHPFDAGTALGMAARVLESDAQPIEGRCPDVPPHLAAVIERCLRKAPAERFASASEIVAALSSDHSGLPQVKLASWWRAHQLTMITLYFAASALAWQIKEWQQGTAAALFLVIGVAATISAIFRSHLLFTERLVGPRAVGFRAERRRATPATLAADLVIALALIMDGVTLSSSRPLASVLTMALGVGIALARLVLEPSTTTATFGPVEPSL
jgi:predicted Ser/Thr protein kinase